MLNRFVVLHGLKEARKGFSLLQCYKEGYLIVVGKLATLLLSYTLRVLVTSYQLPWQRTGSTKTSTKF